MIILLHILVVLLLILYVALLVAGFVRLASSLKKGWRNRRPDPGAMLSWCAAMLGSVGLFMLLPYALIAGRWIKAGDGRVLSIELALFLLVAALPLLFVLASGRGSNPGQDGRPGENTE